MKSCGGVEETLCEKTTSSFHTCGLPLSNIKNPKILSHFKDMTQSIQGTGKELTRNQNIEIPAENQKKGSSNPKEHRLEDVTPPARADFIIKTFQNSLESKV